MESRKHLAVINVKEDRSGMCCSCLFLKTLRVDRTAADRKRSLMRPAAGGESCKAGFFLVSLTSLVSCNTIYIRNSILYYKILGVIF